MDKYKVRYTKVAFLAEPEIIEKTMTTAELISLLQKGGAVMWSAKLVSELTKECSHADKIKLTCQTCGKTIHWHPQVYAVYTGKIECLDCTKKAKIDKTSWQAGYNAGLNGEKSICRQEYDAYSWLSGYIEGKAAKEEGK